MTTKTVNLYTFNELSDAAKEKAREWWRECESLDFGGHGELNEPIETAAKLLGIDLKQHAVKLMGGGTRYEPNVWWTLHVQGAGASYDGTYTAKQTTLSDVKADFGTDAELHRIAGELDALCARNPDASAVIKSDSRGHFLDVECSDVATDADDEAFRDCFRDFARWIYKYIDAEWDYRMSDENVDDSILANEYTFLANGKRED